jgi:putative methyltransferase
LTCSKSAYATVCNTIRNKPVIDSILNHDGGKLRHAIELDQARNQGLSYVLLSELLFGPYGNIRGGGKLKRIILHHEAELREIKDKLVLETEKDETSTSISVSLKFPRYIRVNNLKSYLEDVVHELHLLLGKHYSGSEKGTAPDIYLDPHVPDLIVLSPNCTLPWHELEMVQQGRVILQDKSSCFSALAMVHGHDGTRTESFLHGDYIDACAAPGNKTSHLASLVYARLKKNIPNSKKNTPCRIFALDRSSSRHAILKKRMMQLVPRMSSHDGTSTFIAKSDKQHNENFPVEICTMHQDFLQVDPHDKTFRNVRGILLDPSCSGSGIVNVPGRQADVLLDEKRATTPTSNRIQSLSNFQLVALKHAMSFPQVDRIVYSTCSVHRQENEDVVAMALKETNEVISDDYLKWKVVSPRILLHWERRGCHPHAYLTRTETDSMIRVNGLEGDETNGFFVCYLERVRLTVTNHHECSISSSSSNSSSNSECTNKVTVGIVQNDKHENHNLQDHENGFMPQYARSMETSLNQKNGTVICGVYHPGIFPMAPIQTTSSQLGSTKTVLDPATTSTPKPQSSPQTTSVATTNKTTTSTTKTKIKLNTANSPSLAEKEIEKKQKTLPRKVAKKLKWKRKQMERKLQRLQSSATPQPSAK